MDNERKKIVTKIPADESKTSRVAYGKKIKVAAYCRVSTDSEDQMNSYRAQMEYYTKHISEKMAVSPFRVASRFFRPNLSRVHFPTLQNIISIT